MKSPQFPTFADALARRQRQRENLAGRALLIATGISAVTAIVNFPLGLLGLVFFGGGFLITCYVAGARHDKRSGGRS